MESVGGTETEAATSASTATSEETSIRNQHAQRFSALAHPALRAVVVLCGLVTLAGCTAKVEERAAPAARPARSRTAPPRSAAPAPAASATVGAPAPQATAPANDTRPRASALPVVAAPSAPPGVAAPSAHVATPRPLIRSAVISPDVATSPGEVAGTVLTDPAVVSVVASSVGASMALTRAAPGRFTVGYHIPPNVPWFFKRRYDITVTARTANGRTDHAYVSATLR